MKHFLFITIVSILFCNSMSIQSQTYHENDKEGLRMLMRQQSAEARVLNLEVMGLSISDTINWYTSEAWVPKVKAPDGYDACYWNGENPRRLVSLLINASQSARKLSGGLNCTKFEQLITLCCENNQLTTLDVSGRLNLSRLDCYNNRLTSLDISNTPAIERLSCHINQLSGSFDISGRSQFKRLEIQGNQLTDLKVSDNPQLSYVSCDLNQLENLDISNTPSLKDFGCGGNKLRTLDVSNHLYLQNFYCQSNQLENLDISNTPSLIILYCNDNQLTTLDVSNRLNLSRLECYNNRLTSLDISNTPAIEFLKCHINQLSGSFDISGRSQLKRLEIQSNQLMDLKVSDNPQLSYLTCEINQLGNLDISNTPSLQDFNCGLNKLRTLDVSNHLNLNNFYCAFNQFSTLNISNTPSLKTLHCYDNLLKFSTLPDFQGIEYRYVSQQVIDGGEIPSNYVIDLSSEYNIKGNVTTYQWYDDYWCWSPISIQDQGSGKFIAGVAHEGKALTCIMRNATFPELALYYKVKIVAGKYELLDHLTLVESPHTDYYVAESGQTFKVYASTNALPENVKIGLFKTTGEFLENITISRDNKLYTCRISDAIASNGYMLQPYVDNYDGTRTVLERPEDSFIIDKLPFAFSRQYQQMSSNIQLLSHLVLRTSDKYLHRVYLEETFQVLANFSITPNTRIGLFDVYGQFIEDVTVSVSGINYTCRVSNMVYPNHYVLMPYELIDGDVQVIERISGAPVMDRLPIVVDYNYQLKSALRSTTGLLDIEKDASVSVYPNPVVDMLNVQSSGIVDRIYIYDINGKLVKQLSGSSMISVGELSSGIYMVKVVTANGESIHKVKKN